ncbi:copper resistance protein B [Tsuneonella suprasediminis]|uniref:copper resistance protein B n=1 Tax=Tsuneonella suprasediminis TaxID=2306996 RepID=UPI002F92C50C
MRAAPLLSLALALVPCTAIAQDHQHEAHSAGDMAPPAPTPAQSHAETTAADGGAMDHGAMDHSAMDHSAMNHPGMDHAAMANDAPIPQGPPPPEAFSGPAFAADAFVGPEKMAASRASVVRAVSGMPVFWFQADRAEYRAREGMDGYLWDVQAYYGGDIDKFWLKSEGEGNFGEKPEAAEVQGLWSHAIGPWWDLQAGVRQDFTGAQRTHAVIGVQGLAPYLFEVDAAAFLSTKGDLTARVEAELDQRITQRLILQPRVELNFAAQDIPELGIGAGLDSAEAGLRLRYEFTREFAPYVGIEQEWKAGRSADYARAAGEDSSVTNYVVGLRFWF